LIITPSNTSDLDLQHGPDYQLNGAGLWAASYAESCPVEDVLCPLFSTEYRSNGVHVLYNGQKEPFTGNKWLRMQSLGRGEAYGAIFPVNGDIWPLLDVKVRREHFVPKSTDDRQ
jgi:hypothetical protein